MSKEHKGMEGIVVLDLTSLLPGPYCTSLLQSFGAEVWKIEPPNTGEPNRNIFESFACLNMGKKSITLNLKSKEGLNIIKKMAEKADVFIESFRPGIASRLGLDYAAIKEVNPKIIYCSISGFGQDGLYRNKPAHDINVQALCGSLNTNIQKEGLPDAIFPVGDLAAGLFAALGISNALLKRQRDGEGMYLDISMADGILTWTVLTQLLRIQTKSNISTKEFELMDRGVPTYGLFETRDGQLIALAIVNEDHFWKNFCIAVEKPEWVNMDFQDRIESGLKLREELRRLFRSKTLNDWIKLLEPIDIPITKVNSFEDAIQDPQFKYRRIIHTTEINGYTIPFVRNPVLPTRSNLEIRVPTLGEHTLELMQRIGYDSHEIEKFRMSGII